MHVHNKLLCENVVSLPITLHVDIERKLCHSITIVSYIMMQVALVHGAVQFCRVV